MVPSRLRSSGKGTESKFRRENPDIIHQVALKHGQYGQYAALGLPISCKCICWIGLSGIFKLSATARYLRSRVLATTGKYANEPGAAKLFCIDFEDRDFAVDTFGVHSDNTEVIMGSGRKYGSFRAIA